MSYDILHKMGGWEEAAEIVLQHHEHCNGGGYPKGLEENEICAGAKILAIADTFDACRYARAYRTELKRPLIRAILEINRQADVQFSRQWVDTFNLVAKNNFTAH
jgi:HD-GYP domain-containing protein (c-di-GMP phosphodiesterase class II)